MCLQACAHLETTQFFCPANRNLGQHYFPMCIALPRLLGIRRFKIDRNIRFVLG